MREATFKAPSFPAIVQQFFTAYLVDQRALSPQTVACYRDAIKLFLGFAASRLRQCSAAAGRTLLAPLRQVRIVEPFAAQQGADLAGFGTGVGFGQEAQLVVDREVAARWPRGDLGIGAFGNRHHRGTALRKGTVCNGTWCRHRGHTPLTPYTNSWLTSVSL